jgi:hypothetical protein
MRRFSPLLLASMAIATLGAASPALADVTVQTVTGNDATCTDGGTPCATLAGAVTVANNTPGRTVVRLGPGIFPVSTDVLAPSGEWIVGAGGVQTLIRMVGPDAGLRLWGGSALFSVAITGDRTDDPNLARPWLSLNDNASARNVLMTRTGQGTLVSATGPVTLHNMMLRADPGGFSAALVAFGQVALFDSTVSGREVYAAGDGPVGAAHAPAIWVDRSMLAGGIRVNSGDARVTNSIVLSQDHSGFVTPPITVNSAQANATEPRASQLQFVLSTAWRSDCGAPVSVGKPADARNVATVVLGGSLVGASCAGGAIGANTVQVGASDRVLAWYQMILARPYLVRTQAAGRADTTFSPQPLPCCAWISQDPAPITGTTPGISRVPDGPAGIAPRDFTPVAGSPLSGAATDPYSVQVAQAAPLDFAGRARPMASLAIGALQPMQDGVALPMPRDVGAIPAPEGGFAPVAGDLPGGIDQPGAPRAGQFDPAVGPVQLPDSLGGVVGVQVAVPKRSRVGAALPVTVTVGHAARVVVLVRRPVIGAKGVARSRVLGKVVGTFSGPGTKVLKVRFKASTQRGSVVVGATARSSGLVPGTDSAPSFLSGPAPVTVVPPATLRAGANRMTVRVNRIGNIVLVARTATGRVLGRTAFTATSRGTRRVSLVLSPARLVTGVITISARASGGEPVTLTRSAN